MLRLDQHIQFCAQGVHFVMSLRVSGAENEWIIRPKNPAVVSPRKLRKIEHELAQSWCNVSMVEHELIMYIGFEQYHTISDGIAVRPNWDGQSLGGLLEATACLIAHSLKVIADTFAGCEFQLENGATIIYEQYDNWRAVQLMNPHEVIGEELSEEDEALIRLYGSLGLIRCEEELCGWDPDCDLVLDPSCLDGWEEMDDLWGDGSGECADDLLMCMMEILSGGTHQVHHLPPWAAHMYRAKFPISLN